TGLGTVLDDDPRLDLRLPGPSTPPLQPLRVIADSRLQTPAAARILQPPGRVLLVHADAPSGTRWPEGVETLSLPAGSQVDLAALLDELGRRGVNELHVEAGATLNGALLRAGLVDELLLYLAPALLGEGRGMAALGLLPDLDAAPRFDWLETTPVEGDLRLRLRRPGLDF
ncbi:MAG TPA: RibD family protein, partial [Burkholderiaceae bacterium]|nr:RibD family protein [Burkholderiaceae bacterium]